MQFYIIHDDPETNTNLLPDYAITKVNVREGWQILSDIGHLFGVTWEGQNKPYSIWHAETRRFWKGVDSFIDFLDHYNACLNKYYELKGKTTTYHDKFNLFFKSESLAKIRVAIVNSLIRTDHDQMIFKLITQKREHLSKSEYDKLCGWLYA